MLVRHRGCAPKVDATAYVAPTAVLVGDVTVGRESRIMYGAVLDAEGAGIGVGVCCIVCENAVVRATALGGAGHPVRIEEHVFISPHATLLGCTVEARAYIAASATVLHGAQVGTGAVV